MRQFTFATRAAQRRDSCNTVDRTVSWRFVLILASLLLSQHLFFLDTLQLLLGHKTGKYETSANASSRRLLGQNLEDLASLHRNQGESIKRVLRAYESEFQGEILDVQGCACVASWPGVYAELWYVPVPVSERFRF